MKQLDKSRACDFCHRIKPTLLTSSGRICISCVSKKLHEQHAAPLQQAEKPASAAENFSKVM